MSFSSPQVEPSWHWPGDASTSQGPSELRDAHIPYEATDSTESAPNSSRKHYPPRVCRICLESVPPTFQPPSEHLPSFLQPPPQVIYESSDPELGRLLRPCKCKGSSRYVHEGCLRTWRHTDPEYGKRNYWECPTCRFQYRLERMTWARWISSSATQIGLTLMILLFTIFLLGFIADPIINLYIDPMETIFASEFWEPNPIIDKYPGRERTTWSEHFVKGLASLGVLSFMKALLALSPWHWWNLRSSGLVSSGGRATGRSRLASISWIVVLIGVCSFLWGIYKGVRAWTRRVLEKAGERVMDVPLADDDQEDEGLSSPTSDKGRSEKDD